MSMAEVIESIEREALREAQSREIGGRNGEPIDCSNLALIKEFGVDNSTNFVQIVEDKGKLPLNVGSLVWKRSDVRYKDEENTIVDENSADYIVKGVADEGLTVDLFLLQKNVK